MHIELIRALRFSTACGTLAWGILHTAGTRAEVPDSDGKTMVECGEAVELVEVQTFDIVEAEIEGPPGKGGVATKVKVKNRVPTGSKWVPRSVASQDSPPTEPIDPIEE